MKRIRASRFRPLALGFVMSLGVANLSAQLKSDLILQPISEVQSPLTVWPDTTVVINPLLFRNNEYLRPTAFFCKMEMGLDQKSIMPIRFRLGSVDYVNYLEGKDKTGVVKLNGRN